MAKSTKKSWSAIIYILAVLVIGSLSSTAWTQGQQQPPASDSERKQLLDRLSRQLQEGRSGANPTPQPPQPAAQQPQMQQQPAVSAPAPAIPPAVSSMKNEGGRQLYYENAELYDVIKDIAGELGLTPLIIDPEVKGTVVINSGTITKDDIMPLFNIILKNNGAALIKQGGVYQIMPIPAAIKRGLEVINDLPSEKKGSDQDAKPDAKTPSSAVVKTAVAASQSIAQIPPRPAVSSGSDGIKGTRLATHAIHVDFVPIKELIEVIKEFMTDGGYILPYERLNLLFVTDYSDSVARIEEIIHMLDNAWLDPDLVELVKVENNASSDVVDDLKKIFGSGSKDSATGINFVPLDRMNAIFLTASSKRGLEEAKRWIKKLDAASGRSIQTHIYVVENSTASNIAAMISALYGGEDTGGSSSSNTANNRASGSIGTTGNQGVQNSSFGGMGTTGNSSSLNSSFSRQASTQGLQSNSSFGTSGGNFAGSSYTSGSSRQLGPQLNGNKAVAPQLLKGGAFTGLQDTVRLVADDVNNSLVIQATAADYAYLSETIKKMDVLPRQVLIDARIFEVDLTNSMDFGVGATLQGATASTSGTTVGLGTDGSLTASTTAFVRNSQQVMLALQALSTKTKVRVLEAPSVLALDGMQANVIVGSEIPYPSSNYYQSSGGTTTSVDYRDTGISLIVLPRISASGHVTLEITNEISAPGAAVAIGTSGTAVSFSKTSVNTTLSVKDGETVAIAGLIRDSNTFSRSGIPLLSDIPLIGSLFGYNKRDVTRNELIILITPHVIRTTEALQEKSQELKDSLRHVRKYADEQDKERTNDMEDARKDRYNEELKDSKKVKPVEPTQSKEKKSKHSKKEKKVEQDDKEEKQDEPQPAATPAAPVPPADPASQPSAEKKPQ